MEYFVTALAFLSIPLWFGSMLYLSIKDDDAQGEQADKPSTIQGQQDRKTVKGKHGHSSME